MISQANSQRLNQSVDIMHNNSSNMFNFASPFCFCCPGIMLPQNHFSFDQNKLKKYLTFDQLKQIIIPFKQDIGYKRWSYFSKIYLLLVLSLGAAAIMGFLLSDDIEHPSLAVWMILSLWVFLVLFHNFFQACLLRSLCNHFDQYLDSYNEQSGQMFKIKLIRNGTASLQDGVGCCYGELCSYRPLGLKILPNIQ